MTQVLFVIHLSKVGWSYTRVMGLFCLKFQLNRGVYFPNFLILKIKLDIRYLHNVGKNYETFYHMKCIYKYKNIDLYEKIPQK